MDQLERIVEAIELHDVEDIQQCFAEGLDPNTEFRGEALIFELTSEYTRGPRFKECVKAFVDHGLKLNDDVLLSVLLDNAEELGRLLKERPHAHFKKYTLRCAYTPLHNASLLHICAEFNHVACAKVLVANGLDFNTPAGADEHGFGKQTPIFHTVNQNQHQSSEMMEYLLSLNCDLQVTAPGLIWGKGYPWETLIPAINPISYAMMGLLPQMHRNEMTVSTVVSRLIKAAYGIDYKPANVPNAYLK